MLWYIFQSNIYGQFIILARARIFKNCRNCTDINTENQENKETMKTNKKKTETGTTVDVQTQQAPPREPDREPMCIGKGGLMERERGQQGLCRCATCL